MWRRVRWGWRPVLAAYPLLMTFTVVYTGEHYVIDVLAGWLAAVLVTLLAVFVERRLFRRHEPEVDDRVAEPVAVT
jgi:membrane-associated phospholipid phosphatase